LKYWVYKDSRILGPFEKDAFAGLPGVDSSTLVCAGESAAAGEGDWRPAGDVSDLAALTVDAGASWRGGESSSTFSLLDNLQLEAAGHINDDEFPGAAEDLFQDAEMKRTFGDLLASRPDGDAAELRRAKEHSAELTVQLEMLYKRLAELEAGQTDLVHRLAEKEMLLRGQTPPAIAQPESFLGAPGAAAAPTPGPAPTPTQTPPEIPSATAPGEWSKASTEGGPQGFPSFKAPGAAPASPVPPPTPRPAFASSAPAPAAPPPAAGLPPLKISPPPAGKSAAEAAPKKPLFEKKTFKPISTVKSFKIVGADLPPAGSASTPAPAPESSLAPAAAVPPLEPSPAPVAAPEPLIPAARDQALETALPSMPPAASVPPPGSFAQSAPSPTMKPISLEPLAAPAPTSWPEVPAPINAGRAADATPAPPPPVTLSFGAVQPQATNPPAPGAGVVEPPRTDVPAPPATGIFVGNKDAGAVEGASTQEVLKRLAKPAPAPATSAPRGPRSNKAFLIGGGALVVVMAVIGFLFLRHPKDLKQMAALDDGRARVGAEPVDDASHPPAFKPNPAAAAPAAPAAAGGPPAAPGAAAPAPAPAAAAAAPAPAAEAPQAASKAKLDAAVAAVKDFPLDGERGTVAQLLQFEYSAAPDAGQESWSASETADKTYLVEYHFAPAHGGTDVHYLFEVDMDRGFVIGKNLDAKSILAGGPPAAEKKPKAKPKKTVRKPAKRPAGRVPAEAAPKDVPLLPLPNEGELRPPSEDDGAFNSDTVNTGL
jgi:hypothetical protein